MFSVTRSSGALVQLRPFPRLIGAAAARALGTIPQECPAICLQESTLDEILDYSDQSPRVETGGFLIGARCHDRQFRRDFLDVHHFLPATSTAGGIDSLTFTHETWSSLHQTIAGQFPNSQILGWHHTHPGFGIFLSRHDEFIHRNFFDRPWHLAMVVDPRKGEFGFFQWQGEQLVNNGFLLVPGQRKSPTRSVAKGRKRSA